MTFALHTPEYYRTKLYQKQKEFKNFESLTEENIAKISKKVYFKQEINQINQKRLNYMDKLTKYIDILKYLSNPQIHLEIPTYDERIIFLILSVDPNLISFKEFLKSSIIPLQVIEKEKDPTKKEKLNEQRKIAILDLQTRIREQIGFYDSKLLRYEEIYFKKFLNQKELITKVNQDNITALISIVPYITAFNSISEERYQVLQEKAQIWLSETNATNDLFTAAYSCVNQQDTIGLRNISEQLVFLILTADPELNALRIYEEESKMDEVERRCKEQFNYYNINLLTLEKLYHERFCPKKELSSWTFL